MLLGFLSDTVGKAHWSSLVACTAWLGRRGHSPTGYGNRETGPTAVSRHALGRRRGMRLHRDLEALLHCSTHS